MSITGEVIKTEKENSSEQVLLPKNFEDYVKKRYIDGTIYKLGQPVLIEYFKKVGEGQISIYIWGRIYMELKKAASIAGFDLIRNRRNGRYCLFKKINKKDCISKFNISMLDTVAQ